VPPETAAIVSGIRKAIALDCTQIANPYGAGETSAEICTVLETIPDFKHLLKKHFYEL
jgi:UDP-N-acetylglucosamine 2-epimerase (non-hydrolysing)/GDP/UDP-N,N'-diacetylbacillosamine 2-epimerase (hydrolysing)